MFESDFDIIGESAFSGCTALTSVAMLVLDEERAAFGDIVQSSAFSGCTNLTDIPCVYQYVGSLAFKDCVGLMDIELSASHVEFDAFAGCTALKSARLESGELLYAVTDDEHSLSSLVEVALWGYKPTEAFLSRYSKIAEDGNYTVYSRCAHEWKVQDGGEPDGCAFDGTCTLCGRTKNNIKNHTAGEWETVKEPTETEKGKRQRACTACGKVMETEELDMLPLSETSTAEASTEEMSQEASSAPAVSTEPSETTDAGTDEQTNGVPVWAVELIALLAAACGIGVTYPIIKKRT